ncbi:glycosyltransferase family 39 protein [Dyadobacter luticola]|uniref:Glycosyltransferase RgtA/B/C/D-like domain-containing protein n=1 Tax=Dyadobacter luticola TaxID=1979387 RepID=A0A5R9L237_9BACT|nr:glycosyltransferase family 39 protein [Dyadobacter luticola]TLV02593.1 hypothetical protein FEN17_02935 [Dyadobacter luticola]
MKLPYNLHSIKRIHFYSALLIFLCFIPTVIFRVILAKSHHSDLGGVEQNVIYSIQKLIFNGDLYSDPANIPFTITQYSPFYHYLCGLIAFITGQDPGENIYQLYVIGRGLNIIINVLLAFTVYKIAFQRLGLSAALSAAIGLACFVCVFRQGFTVRPDSLMDFMIILSVYFFLGYLQKKVLNSQSVNLIIASFLSAAVIFAKQSGIQIPVILLGFLVFTGRWKDLIKSGLTFSVSFVALLGLMLLLYKDAFLKNVVGGVANGIDTSWFFLYVFGNGFKIKILIPAAIVLIITFYKWAIFKGDIITRFLAFCACGMFAFAGITVLKSGSNVAYFSPFFIISLLLFAWKLKNSNPVYQANFLLNIAFISYISGICILNVIYQYSEVKKTEIDGKEEVIRRESLAANVATFVKNQLKEDEYIFANLNDESILQTSYGRRGINNILFKNSLIPELDIFKSSNVKSGVLGYDLFRQTLLSGKAKFIIESTSVFTFKIIPDLPEIKKSNYHLFKEIDEYQIYRHNLYKAAE